MVKGQTEVNFGLVTWSSFSLYPYVTIASIVCFNSNFTCMWFRSWPQLRCFMWSGWAGDLKCSYMLCVGLCTGRFVSKYCDLWSWIIKLFERGFETVSILPLMVFQWFGKDKIILNKYTFSVYKNNPDYFTHSLAYCNILKNIYVSCKHYFNFKQYCSAVMRTSFCVQGNGSYLFCWLFLCLSIFLSPSLPPSSWYPRDRKSVV